MDSMSALDASFLYMEDETNRMHVAALSIFEGPPPAPGEIEEMIATKLDRVPRYRQKLRFLPFGLGRPVWSDDHRFDLGYHVRRTALPAPGDAAVLETTMSRLVSSPLDMTRPLWELWVVEGLSDDRWAMISKTHHCMVDGVSGTDLMAILMDAQPEPEAPRIPRRPWQPEPHPSAWRLASQSLSELFEQPRDAVDLVRTAVASPARTLRRLGEFADSLSTFRQHGEEDLESSLNGPIGPHRRWRSTETSIADLQKIRAAHGGTLNDVVLSVVTGAFRTLLMSRGEAVADRYVRSLVPVNVRPEGERGVLNNRVAAMFIDLPVGIADPVERLVAVRTEMDDLKEHHQADTTVALASVSDHTPAVLMSLATRVFAHLEQHAVQTVTTNVPGPRQPLYAAGRRMLAVYPFVPLFGSVRIGTALFSYAGQIAFGVTGDYESMPDVDVFIEGLDASLADLLAAS